MPKRSGKQTPLVEKGPTKVKIVLKGEIGQEFWDNIRRMDAWNNTHMPQQGTRENAGSRRVARDRHLLLACQPYSVSSITPSHCLLSTVY